MSECITCTYYGKHLEGDGDKLPWPCVECHYGERYVKKGERKPPAPIKAELAALREQVKVLREALKLAKGFIKNGLDLGHITPPEPGDAAYDTLPTICKALEQTKPTEAKL